VPVSCPVASASVFTIVRCAWRECQSPPNPRPISRHNAATSSMRMAACACAPSRMARSMWEGEKGLMREKYMLAQRFAKRIGSIEEQLPTLPSHHRDHSMLRLNIPCRFQAVASLAVATCYLGFGTFGRAEEIQHLSITLPGGMPGLPVMGPIRQISN